MNFVDIGLFLIIALSIFIGWKRGVIKASVRLIGLVVVAIISYVLTPFLAGFLIDLLPFFNFGGIFDEILGINILFYYSVSYIFIFLMLFSIINIIINIAGILDKLLRMTIILALPDKILGAVVGFVEGVMIAFILIFIAAIFPNTQEYVFESRYGSIVLHRTPIIRRVLADSILTAEEINLSSIEYEEDDDAQKFQIEILQAMIKYQLITSEKVEELIEKEKINLNNVTFN